MLQKAITFRAMRLGAKKIGFADLSAVGHPLTCRYPTGIALVIPMDNAIVGGEDEPAFFRHQVQQRDELEAIKVSLGSILKEHFYNFHSVSNDMDQDRLVGELSHKMVANLAGLGWIGKSTLFVTPEYGPRVRLTSLLTDVRFSTRTVQPESKCGNCDSCVTACPAGALKNVEWKPGRGRDELLDVGLCIAYRTTMSPDKSRRYSCARCLNACPPGMRR
jgi:epoxyqueuosine reductase